MRVIAYVDGFNFYHGLISYIGLHPSALPGNKVDLWRFIQAHMLHHGESLKAVRWYSAIPEQNRFDSEQIALVKRHQEYRANLESVGVTVRISGFKKRPVKCKHCGKTTKHKQEKESDKRCSLEILEDAVFDRMDRALLFSSDSDHVPVLHSLKRYSAVRKVDVVICPPLGRESPAKDILKETKKVFGTSPRYTRKSHLADSLFDE